MSVIPYLFDDFYRPSRLLNQRFGVDLDTEDLFSPLILDSFRSRHFPSWKNLLSEKGGFGDVVADKDKFQVNIDVQQFTPSEITVKTTGDDTIEVEGKHEEKKDEHGFISRHFVRKYVIPKGHDVNNVVTNLSSDGVLTVTAPRVDNNSGEQKRTIPIQQTGRPSSVVDVTSKQTTNLRSNERQIPIQRVM